ncbi:MAG: hypothetical protein JWN41_79, partial [Thermoleophilia bacterium]|nr:hypothetical protein [Thermoleophilia bacterium]
FLGVVVQAHGPRAERVVADLIAQCNWTGHAAVLGSSSSTELIVSSGDPHPNGRTDSPCESEQSVLRALTRVIADASNIHLDYAQAEDGRVSVGFAVA